MKAEVAALKGQPGGGKSSNKTPAYKKNPAAKYSAKKPKQFLTKEAWSKLSDEEKKSIREARRKAGIQTKGDDRSVKSIKSNKKDKDDGSDVEVMEVDEEDETTPSEVTAKLDRTTGVRLVERPADGICHSDRAIGRKRDAVQARHHRVGVGDTLVHAGRTRAAQQHLPVGQAGAGLQENPPDVSGIRRLEGARMPRRNRNLQIESNRR